MIKTDKYVAYKASDYSHLKGRLVKVNYGEHEGLTGLVRYVGINYRGTVFVSIIEAPKSDSYVNVSIKNIDVI